MKHTNSQSGFGTLGIIITLVAITIVGALGYTFYQQTHRHAEPVKVNNASQEADKDTKKDVNSDKTDEQPKNITNKATNVLTIPELGVSMTLPEGLEADDVTYLYAKHTATENDPDPGGTVVFTTKSLLQIDSRCTPEYGIGGLSRSSVKPNIVSVLTHQIGDYYYTYFTPQSVCTDNPDGEKLQQGQTSLIRQAFDTIRQSN